MRNVWQDENSDRGTKMKLDLMKSIKEYEKEFLKDPFIVSYLNSAIEICNDKQISKYIDPNHKKEYLFYAKILKRILEIFGLIKIRDKFKYSYFDNYDRNYYIKISIKKYLWVYKFIFNMHIGFSEENFSVMDLNIQSIKNQGEINFLKDLLQYIINKNQNKKIKMPEIKIKTEKLIKNRSDLIDLD